MTVRIDKQRIARLAASAGRVALNPASHLPKHRGRELSRGERLLLWFVATGICQQTRALEGTVDGVWCRGSDYLTRRLAAHLAAHPAAWTCEALARLGPEELAAMVSDDGIGATSTLDRREERAHHTRQMATWLLEEHGGDIERFLPANAAQDARALLAELAPLEAYEDPLRKKSCLLLMTLEAERLVALDHREAIRLPVDYHVMRVLLRAGAVVVTNPQLELRLRLRETVLGYQEEAIRLACQDAAAEMVRLGMGLFELDALLWSVGRNCCRENDAPLCRVGSTCPLKPDRCSLIQSFRYACPDACPLESGCASAGKAGALLNAPVVETHYY